MKKCCSFEEQKSARYIREKSFIWHYCLQLSFVCKTVSQISFKLFCLGYKRLRRYQSSLGNYVDLRDIMNASQNILAKNQNLKKLRHGFVDKRALITTTSLSSCHWKTHAPFCLWKKRSENAFLTLIVNCRKFVQKNKLWHSKQQIIGYLMIYDVIYYLLWLKNWRFPINICMGLLYP